MLAPLVTASCRLCADASSAGGTVACVLAMSERNCERSVCVACILGSEGNLNGALSGREEKGLPLSRTSLKAGMSLIVLSHTVTACTRMGTMGRGRLCMPVEWRGAYMSASRMAISAMHASPEQKMYTACHGRERQDRPPADLKCQSSFPDMRKHRAAVLHAHGACSCACLHPGPACTALVPRDVAPRVTQMAGG